MHLLSAGSEQEGRSKAQGWIVQMWHSHLLPHESDGFQLYCRQRAVHQVPDGAAGAVVPAQRPLPLSPLL